MKACNPNHLCCNNLRATYGTQTATTAMRSLNMKYDLTQVELLLARTRPHLTMLPVTSWTTAQVNSTRSYQQ